MSGPSPPLDATNVTGARVYTSQFWLAYVANFALVAANTLMYRFAELVAFLGGTEQAAGAIVGTGFAAALLMRLVIGQGVDRYGTRRVWVLSTSLFILGAASLLLCQRVSFGLYLARILYSLGMAGMLTCSVVHVQDLVPLYKRTEAIGILGTGGFLGMITGSNLGDGIFTLYPLGHARFAALCSAVAALGVFYLACVLVMRGHAHVPLPNAPPALKLLIHYWPGTVVAVAITLGMGFSLTTVFLTRFATQRHIPGIRTFFTVYALVALVFRLPGTRWARTIGRHKTILVGLSGNALGHLLLPLVSRDWQFLLPATACGFGHALLYPAIVSLGAGSFPRRYRGLGTTLVLGLIDFGTAVSPPILGTIIDHWGFDVMFDLAALTGFGVMLYYALTAARQPDSDNDPEPEILLAEPELAVVPEPESAAPG
ncbi:MAG TPA: MFS transporter [Planctomycetaceae bacterium]|nr:MFS transporter [Planctomycetaceae bacterium]